MVGAHTRDVNVYLRRSLIGNHFARFSAKVGFSGFQYVLPVHPCSSIVNIASLVEVPWSKAGLNRTNYTESL